MTTSGKSSLPGDMMRALQKLTKRRSAPVTMADRASSSTKAMGNSQGRLQLQTDPNIRQLQILCAQFHLSCSTCKVPLEIDLEEQVLAWRSGAQTIPPKSQIPSLRCALDKEHLMCAGCGKAPKFSEDNIFTSLGVVNHCCNQGRLFGIYFLLSRYDEAQLVQAVPSTKKGKKLAKQKLNWNNAGVGYAPGYNDYMDVDIYDYAGFDGPWGSRPVLSSVEHELNRKNQDILLTETLKLLGPFLPSPGADATGEYHMLRLSFLIDRITDLIRNDSISDITDRFELYSEVVAFAQAIAERPGLISLLNSPRALKINSPGLRNIGIPKTPSTGFVLDDSPESKSASFFTASADTYRVAKAFLKLADKQKAHFTSSDDGFNGQGNDAVSFFCRRFLVLYGTLEKNLGRTTGVSNSESRDSWTVFAEENRVTFTDEVLNNHRYHREIALLSSSPKKGRMNTISKEVATMTTSLPTGIFLKIAESRSDVMKVLIVGSEGSPYAGGLFIFDLFLDADYPATPPKMAFVLNGNDSDAHSFNPNLHRGGGVCLSILNTWSGSAVERWQPNKSTILAVLISIQAMILGAPVPWINEPGYEGQANTKQAEEHRLLIQTKTINYAMISWLENDFKSPNTVDFVWRDISQAYWKHNGMEALGHVRQWAKENPALASYDPANPTGKKPKKGKGKSKATVATEPEPVLARSNVNLVEKLERLLGIEPEPEPAEEAATSKIGGLMNRFKGKRKASDSEAIPHHLKKQKSESPGFTSKWIYTGGKTQKEVRAVCKEFGIGSKPTIKDTIAKLEQHVNDKGKANPQLVEKYGTIIVVEDGVSASSSSMGSAL